MAKEIKTYNQRLTCSNCGHSYTDEIPMGFEIQHFTEFHPCPQCGCKTLSKGSEPISRYKYEKELS